MENEPGGENPLTGHRGMNRVVLAVLILAGLLAVYVLFFKQKSSGGTSSAAGTASGTPAVQYIPTSGPTYSTTTYNVTDGNQPPPSGAPPIPTPPPWSPPGQGGPPPPPWGPGPPPARNPPPISGPPPGTVVPGPPIGVTWSTTPPPNLVNGISQQLSGPQPGGGAPLPAWQQALISHQ